MNRKLGLALACALALPACAADDTAVGVDGGAGIDATTPLIDGSQPGTDTSVPGTDTGVDATPGTEAGGEGDAGADAGAEADADAGAEADADAGAEADADAGAEADAEAGADAGHDAGTDAGHDAGTDAGHDAGTDAGHDAGTTCLPAGTWLATSVSCNGTPVSIAPLTWTAIVSGNNGSFNELLNGCTLTENGPILCAGNVVQTVQNTPQTCNPANCSTWGAQCGATPAGGEASWLYVQNSATQFTLTSTNNPDAGPTPIKTCTASGHQNPVTVVWTKQ